MTEKIKNDLDSRIESLRKSFADALDENIRNARKKESEKYVYDELKDFASMLGFSSKNVDAVKKNAKNIHNFLQDLLAEAEKESVSNAETRAAAENEADLNEDSCRDWCKKTEFRSENKTSYFEIEIHGKPIRVTAVSNLSPSMEREIEYIVRWDGNAVCIGNSDKFDFIEMYLGSVVSDYKDEITNMTVKFKFEDESKNSGITYVFAYKPKFGLAGLLDFREREVYFDENFGRLMDVVETDDEGEDDCTGDFDSIESDECENTWRDPAFCKIDNDGECVVASFTDGTEMPFGMLHDDCEIMIAEQMKKVSDKIVKGGIGFYASSVVLRAINRGDFEFIKSVGKDVNGNRDIVGIYISRNSYERNMDCKFHFIGIANPWYGDMFSDKSIEDSIKSMLGFREVYIDKDPFNESISMRF